jgi:hypothetical protein
MARIAEGYDSVEDVDSFVAALGHSRARIDIFTFIQSLSDTTPRYRYPMEWDNLAAVRVSSFEHWFNHQVNRKTRNMIRKGEKCGVTVREVPFDDALIAGIKGINDETPIRQGRPFWHYLDDLQTVRRENGTFQDRSVFIGAFLGDTLIGYVKLTSDESRRQAGLMQVVSMIRHRDKAPTNMLIAEAVRLCAKRGVAYLWYARFSYGNKRPDSLADFKLHNGFEQVDIPRYYIPLTHVGRIALRLGLHHRLADRIPQPIRERIRGLRNQWHASRALRQGTAGSSEPEELEQT